MEGKGGKMYIQNIALYAIIMTLIGCAAFQPTEKVLNPARAPQVAELNTVAIANFQGKDGELFRQELQARLLSENAKQGIFRIVNSTRTADGIFSGQVLDSSISYKNYTKEVEDCERKSMFGACKEGTKTTTNVQCVDRKANFKVIFSVTKRKTDEVIYSSTFTGDDTDTHCNNSSTSPITDNAMLLKARAKVLDEIRKDIAPYYTGGEILLFRPDKWAN
jgi:hypothetical protein